MSALFLSAFNRCKYFVAIALNINLYTPKSATKPRLTYAEKIKHLPLKNETFETVIKRVTCAPQAYANHYKAIRPAPHRPINPAHIGLYIHTNIDLNKYNLSLWAVCEYPYKGSNNSMVNLYGRFKMMHTLRLVTN